VDKKFNNASCVGVGTSVFGVERGEGVGGSSVGRGAEDGAFSAFCGGGFCDKSELKRLNKANGSIKIASNLQKIVRFQKISRKKAKNRRRFLLL